MQNGKVSFWWEQIGQPTPRPSLHGNLDVDVAIVGAGYTGLWSAYYLKQTSPNLRVAIIEQRHAGYGASGRNGGWLTNTVTGGREQYVKKHGREKAEQFQLAMNQTVDEVIRVAEVEGIDAEIVKGGAFMAAYTPAQASRLKATVTAEQQWPFTDIELLQSERAKAQINIEGMVVGSWHPHAAKIQPAKLARGLAQTVERLGVEIYENTLVLEIKPRELITTHGTVRATNIVRATEGFTPALKGLKRLWLPMNSSLIVTEPLDDQLWEDIGWRNGEVLGDFAHVYMYSQRTADNRIAIGGRGVPYRWASGIDTDGQTPDATVQQLRNVLTRLFPGTKDSKIEHTWSGVLGVPRDWAATVGLDESTGIAWGGGYVGTGVTSTNLAGRTIADLILKNDSDLVTLPWVNHVVRKWEPEPLRWLATKGLYAAYGFADKQEANGRATTSPIARVADLITGRANLKTTN